MSHALRGVFIAMALAAASSAHAQLTATLATVPAPFANAENGRDAWSGATSSLTLVVRNTSATALHRLDVALPNTGYAARAGSASGWTGSAVAASGTTPAYLHFTSACNTAGLAAGASATFVVTFATPNVALAADTTTVTPFTVTGTNQSTGTGAADPTCSGALVRSTATVPSVPVKALLVTGRVSSTTSFFAAPATVTTTWTVRNLASGTKYGITLTPVVTPAATSTTCGTVTPVRTGQTGTITCTHVLGAGGTYTFAASASGRVTVTGAVDSTAVGAYALPASGTTPVIVQVGSPTATWSLSTMVRNRHLPYTVAFNVVNASPFAITRVALGGATPTGFTLASATVSSGSGLTYVGAQNNALVFTGSLAAGATATITVQLAGTAPTTTTTYATQVTLTPATGTAVTVNGQVRLVVPLPDVSGLTLLSSTSGQRLAWVNTSGSGSVHDGVVVFRTPSPTVPPAPTDFVDYQANPVATAIYADRNGATVATLVDAVTGAYNYRVCNHDAFFVYSDCSSGFWNLSGYVDSATAPAGGWTHQLGGEDLAFISALSMGSAAIPTNRPDMTVLSLATGQRTGNPVALPAGSLPPANSPGSQLGNGRWIAFSADQGGAITAVDLEAGTQYWQVTKPGESFVAGVSGVIRSSAASAFQVAYPMDVLFLGSATTGNVLAVNAATGATLWTVNVGASVYALTLYDPTTNFVYVATSGAGVVALDLGPSSPIVAARPAVSFANPGGNYRQFCVRTPVATALGCVDTSGVLRVLDRTSGAVRAQLATGVSSPSMLSKVQNGTPGFVLGNSSQVLRVTANATLTTLSAGGRWQPSGQVLSPLFVNSAAGWIMVASSDLRLHKLSSETAGDLGTSPAITTRTTGVHLGPPAYDSTNQRFVFGTSEGRVWSVPVF